MNAPVTAWLGLALHQTQRCCQLAWFLYGWLEREQRLNLDACAAWWLRGGSATPGRLAIHRSASLHAVTAASTIKANDASALVGSLLSIERHVS